MAKASQRGKAQSRKAAKPLSARLAMRVAIGPPGEGPDVSRVYVVSQGECERRYQTLVRFTAEEPSSSSAAAYHERVHRNAPYGATAPSSPLLTVCLQTRRKASGFAGTTQHNVGEKPLQDGLHRYKSGRVGTAPHAFQDRRIQPLCHLSVRLCGASPLDWCHLGAISRSTSGKSSLCGGWARACPPRRRLHPSCILRSHHAARSFRFNDLLDLRASASSKSYE